MMWPSVSLIVGRVVDVYACVGDDVECGCAGYVVAKRVDGRVIAGGDECCCV